LGRFVLPQIMENSKRLISHQVRIPDGLIKASYQDAVSQAAEKLTKYSGDGFALIAHEAAPREEIYVLKKFTKEVMKSQNFAMAGIANGHMVIRPAEIADAIKEGKVKALYTTGDYLDSNTLDSLDTLIVSDMFPSETEKLADVVFASSGPTEIDGTFLNADGDIKTVTAAAIPPEGIFPDWKIVCDTAKKMGVDGFDFRSTDDIQKEMAGKAKDGEVPTAPEPSPLDDVSVLPRFYRGHCLNDIVCALEAFVRERPEKTEVSTVDGERPFKILEKVEIVPNTHMVTVHAPVIAEKCEPGQFVIAMVNEKSERIPYTISDFDREKGSITMIILEVGRSSREMANMRTGDHLAHLAGPLGMPVEVKKYGTVVCAGGCFGIGAILPIARAMKDAGNKVICIEEASSHYLLHWKERLSENCHELIIVTKDGSSGMKGGIQDAISMVQKRGEKIDQAYVVGCTFMMMLACETAKTLNIPTQTAMNPIMLDGTGMCGACRVSMGKNTKFACVDGPFLDGLQIDWIELIQRQAAFRREEVEALPQDPLAGHEHHCMGLNA
jgi:NAD(P)H-flavin reductase